MSWDWSQKYLPEDIHVKDGEFQTTLDLLERHRCVDYDEGCLIALGFGLLLRECWRAMEVESDDDDQDTPNFLRQSRLDETNVKQAIEVIERVMCQSTSQKEKIPGEKMLATKKYIAHTLFQKRLPPKRLTLRHLPLKSLTPRRLATPSNKGPKASGPRCLPRKFVAMRSIVVSR